MAKEYFIIFDRSDLWQITGTTIIPDGYEVSEKNDGVFDASHYHMKVVFSFVKDNLETNKIFMPKNFEGNLTINDLILIPYDMLEVKKSRMINKGKDVLVKKSSFVEVFSSVEFIILNNYLLDKGFVITDENRHDKYLEIIETGDIEIIERLESYLKCRDEIMLNYTFYAFFREFRLTVEKAEDDDDLNKAWKEFVAMF